MAGLDLSSLKPVQPNQAEASPPAGALDVSTLRPYGTSAPPKGPVEPTTSPIEDLGFAASRVGTAIPHLLEFAADTPQHLGALAQWGVSGEKTGVTADQPKTAATFDQFAKQTLGEPDFERYPSNGYDPKKLGDLYKDFLAAPQNAELAERSRAAKVPQAYRAPMIGTDILGKQLGAAAEGVKQLTGVDLNAAFPEAKNAKQQVIEGLTEGAVTGGTSIPRSIVRGALPALARQAGEKFTAAEASALRREIAADLLTGGVGGATGTMAAQNAPEGWELPAGIAGGLAGGIGSVGAMHGLDTAARKGAEYLRPAFPTKGNVERLAADAARASASNPEKAAVDIASATAPEGVEFTAGQASQDTGLLNLEQTLARGKDQKFKEAMVDRAREQNAAMVENLRRIEEGASPTSMSQFFADRMAQLQARNDELHDSARKLAQAKADTLEAPDAADVGGGLQDALASEQTRIKDEISALDKAIDPDGSMVLPTRDVRARADEIYANMSPEERLSITPEERAMLDIIKGYGDVLPYQRFRDLRTQLNEDMRNARGAGKNRAYGRLAQLRAALEEDIKAAVENRFSQNSSTAEDFVRDAREWYTTSVEQQASERSIPRAEVATAGSARAIPATRGEEGAQGGIAPALARDTRLSANDAGERLAVEGSTFDQGAHEAATSPLNDAPEPTQAQKEAGNYKVGRARLGGLDISVENPAGSVRSGKDRGGKPWSVEMNDHYGYIRGNTGRDGDNLDVFVKAGTETLADDAPVFVVDQVDPTTGKFDETKTFLGYPDIEAAEKAYRSNYDKNWKGMGAITPTTLGGLKDWIKTGKTRGRFANSRFVDADAAKRLKDVTGKWKNYYGTYTDKGAAPVPAIVAKTKGESYGFDLPPESVTKAAWKPGADGATAIRNLLNAAGNRRAEVMQGIEQSAMLSLARSAMKDGVVDPASFDKWKAKHSDALKAVPDLAKRMDSAANASREMNRIAKVNQDHLAAAQRSAAGAILKLGPDADEADIARKVGSMLSQQNGAKQMRELVRLTDGDPDALAGLRRAVVDHAISHFTRDDMMRAGAFSTWLGKNRGALSQALSAEQMQALNALSAAADRIGRMIRAPGGGSPTVEYLSGLIERGESPSMLMSVLGNVAKNAVQSGLVGLGGHAVAGLGVGVGAAAGSFLSKLGIDALRARGFSKADDLLREAILDPQLMRRLLMKAPKRKGSGAAKELERALTGSITGLLAANRERDRNKQPRDMRPRAEQPKYTPMMGVRG